ncbi:MAG: DUF3301 domain-containing protein [Ignavibacteria bacterium]
MPPELAGLLLLAALAWLWYDSLRARDAGIQAVRAACAAEDLQLLDETVAIVGLRPARDDEGRMTLRRVYEFEYTDTGDNRRRGSIVMLGQRALVVNIGLRSVPSERTLH